MINEVSIQYAKSLFELRDHRDLQESDNANLKVLQAVFSDSEVIKVIKHPKVSNQAQKELIDQLIKNKVDATFLHFMYVLIDNQRIDALAGISEAYEELLNNEKGLIVAHVLTKEALSDEALKTIKSRLAKKYQKEISVKVEICPTLSSGVKVRVGDIIYDATTLTQLQQMKNILKG